MTGGPLGEARDPVGVTVEVRPGGGLHSLTITDRSMRMGGEALAATVLGLVRTATARANARVRAVTGISEADLDALGLGIHDADLAEDVECTTPDTWMRR
ncbi:MAG TPA: YbaB/EbfC family DNA-binding protein [Pseudonocardiaceae bacterium]